MTERRSWLQHRVAHWVGAVFLLVALVSGWVWWRTRPDGRLHIIAPALKGDTLVLITPNGKTILIDGSADAVGITAFVGAKLPFWRRSLDALVVTRSDAQQLSGVLAVARRYTIGRTLLAPLGDTAQAAALQSALSEEGTRLDWAAANDTLVIDNVRLVVLQPASAEGGLTLALQYGTFSAILAPAPDELQSAQLGRSAPAATLLWWPWARPDDRQLAERMDAAVVLYSESGRGREEPRSLFERGSEQRRLLHEKLQGTIEITTDGTRMWITTEKGN